MRTFRTETLDGYMYYVTRTKTGNTIVLNEQPPFSLSEHTIERSDVVRTPAVNGWRDPSGYVCRSREFSGLTGQVTEHTYQKQGDPDDRIYYYQGNLAAWTYIERLPAQLDEPDANMIHQAEIGALLKLRDQKVNLALAAAESRKSAQLVATRVQQLYRSYSQLRKGNLTAAWKAIGLHPANNGKQVARTTLEVQYGWRPLMQDIYGVVDSISKGIAQKGLLIKVVKDQQKVDVRQFVNSATGRFRLNCNIRTAKRVRVCLWYKVENDYLNKASELGFVDPASIVWELTPYSFLVDWIVPIGDYLASLTATSGTSFVSGTCTTSTRATFKQSLIGYTYDNAYEHTVGGGEASCMETGFSMNRSLYKSSPIPVPFYKSPFSFQHAINAVALFRGKFK